MGWAGFSHGLWHGVFICQRNLLLQGVHYSSQRRALSNDHELLKKKKKIYRLPVRDLQCCLNALDCTHLNGPVGSRLV
jgi:hypothetical protein